MEAKWDAIRLSFSLPPDALVTDGRLPYPTMSNGAPRNRTRRGSGAGRSFAMPWARHHQ
jgi:hypothetical protein